MRTELPPLKVDRACPFKASSNPPAKNMQPKSLPKDGARIKVLIGDREGVFRLGLKKLFSVEDDLRVVAQAENASQLLAMAKSFKPDLLIIQDVIARDESLDLLLQVRQRFANCKVIVTGSQLSCDEQRMLLNDGVSGVIRRSAQPENFVENVRLVMAGAENLLPEQESAHNEQSLTRDDPQLRPVDTLTRRERTVISCLTQGWRNREIAQHLTITEQTVKNHLRSIYDKVGVSDRLELVLYAIHQRLELPPVDSYS